MRISLKDLNQNLKVTGIYGIDYCCYCDCKRFFERGVCGVYGFLFKNYISVDGVRIRGESILNCNIRNSIGFNPELVICRGLKDSKSFRPCDFVEDCFQYNCVDYFDFKVVDKNENM